MANIDKNTVNNALYTKLIGSVALVALLDTDASYSGVYRLEAPEGSKFPYLTYFRVTAPDVSTFDSEVQEVLYQITAHAKTTATKTAAEAAGDIMTEVANALNLQDLAYTGFVFCVYDQDLGESYDEETEVATDIVQYAIRTTVTR